MLFSRKWKKEDERGVVELTDISFFFRTKKKEWTHECLKKENDGDIFLNLPLSPMRSNLTLLSKCSTPSAAMILLKNAWSWLNPKIDDENRWCQAFFEKSESWDRILCIPSMMLWKWSKLNETTRIQLSHPFSKKKVAWRDCILFILYLEKILPNY